MIGLFILRLAVATVFIRHGLPKIKNPQTMASGMGWGAWRVVLLGLVESLSGIALVVGFRMEIAAALLGVVMFGAIYYKIFKWKAPFTGNGGWELDMLLLAVNIAIILSVGPIKNIL